MYPVYVTKISNDDIINFVISSIDKLIDGNLRKVFLFCQSKIGKSKWSRGNVCNVFLWRGSRCQLLWRRVDRSYTKHMSLPRMIDVVGPCYATADECSQWLEQGASGSIKMDEINIGSQRRPLCFQPSIWRRGIESCDLVASSCSYRFSFFV